jgi:hypothetical protein
MPLIFWHRHTRIEILTPKQEALSVSMAYDRFLPHEVVDTALAARQIFRSLIDVKPGFPDVCEWDDPASYLRSKLLD